VRTTRLSRAALLVAITVTLADSVNVVRAWGSVGDRAAAVAALFCTFGAVIAFALFGTALVGRVLPRPVWAARAVLGCAVAVPLGLHLAGTHSAHAALGRAAPLVAVAIVVGVALALARLPMRGPLRGFAAIGGLIALGLNQLLPLRLWPEPRLVLLAGGAWLFGRALASEEGAPIRVSRALATAVGASALAGALLSASPTTRFIARVQAPNGSLVLGVVHEHIGEVASVRVARAARTRAAAPSEMSALFPDANLLLITVDALRAIGSPTRSTQPGCSSTGASGSPATPPRASASSGRTPARSMARR
jgi:hypothetical protein